MANGSKFDKIKVTAETEQAVSAVIKSEAASLSLKTVARIKAKFEAYERVAKSYDSFIEREASKLEEGMLADTVFKELGIAHLVARWLIETQQFITSNEYLLSETDKSSRRGFVEESFANFPEDIKKGLMISLNEKKQELLVWLAGEIEKAKQEVEDRRKIASIEEMHE